MIEYKSCTNTLKEISKDTSKVKSTGKVFYMTDSQIEVVDFDLFQEKFLKKHFPKAYKPCSVDAFCIMNGQWCLIEFKNGFVDKGELNNKIGNSVSIITFKNNINPKTFKENSKFILVYNKDCAFKDSKSYEYQNEDVYLQPQQLLESASFNVIQEGFCKIAKKPIIRYRLEAYKGVYFTEVMTMDKDIFNQYIQDRTITIPQD